MRIEDPRDAPAPPIAPSLVPPAIYTPLRVRDVTMTLPAPNPVLVLLEQDAPHRELRIPVGLAEGTAIAFALRRIETPRPLTHELFAQALEAGGVTLEAVRLTGLAGATYLAEMVISGFHGQHVLACRPSDGVALALRQRLEVPITASLTLLDAAGYPPGSAG